MSAGALAINKNLILFTDWLASLCEIIPSEAILAYTLIVFIERVDRALLAFAIVLDISIVADTLVTDVHFILSAEEVTSYFLRVISVTRNAFTFSISEDRILWTFSAHTVKSREAIIANTFSISPDFIQTTNEDARIV